MYNVFLASDPVPGELIGSAPCNDYFNEHRQEWADEVFGKLHELGIPEAWPEDLKIQNRLIFQAKSFGRIPHTIQTQAVVIKDQYTGHEQHSSVQQAFNRTFHLLQNQLYIFTAGEDWWPHAKCFLAKDADSFMLYFLYNEAVRDKDVLATKQSRGRGRPRNDAAHAAKAEKSVRYQAWLAECAAYRERVEAAKGEYQAAKLHATSLLRELERMERAGAPKWVP